MPFPVKTCVVCSEEFELKPDHPGYANRCRDCNAPQPERAAATDQADKGMNEARRAAIKDMLYTRK